MEMDRSGNFNKKIKPFTKNGFGGFKRYKDNYLRTSLTVSTMVIWPSVTGTERVDVL